MQQGFFFIFLKIYIREDFTNSDHDKQILINDIIN